jgi:hypothetical protein
MGTFNMRNVKKFYGQVKQIFGGFKNLAYETKDVVFLYREKKVRTLTRLEAEKVRSNTASLIKLSGFYILQSIPILGLIPIYFALQNKRVYLTSHFWSDDEFNNYLCDEYEERKEFREKLINYLNLTPTQIGYKSTKGISQKDFLSYLSKWNNIDAINDPMHLHLLSSTNNISSQLILKYTPSFGIRYWLKSRAQEILDDDELLSKEGLTNLSLKELQVACLRRGINPLGDRLELQISLSRWLSITTTIITNSDKSSIRVLANWRNPSFLNHNIALQPRLISSVVDSDLFI